MRRGFARTVLLVIGAVVAAGCGILQPAQGWVFPTAAPRPMAPWPPHAEPFASVLLGSVQ